MKKFLAFTIFVCFVSVFIVEVLAQADKIKIAVEKLPKIYRNDVLNSLNLAEANASSLMEVIDSVSPDQIESVAFLLANMPEHDLKQLTNQFLLENIRMSHKAMHEAPWGDKIPKEIFLNYVLPYANVNERRDNWRKDFYERFSDIEKKTRSIGRAAIVLNNYVFQELDVSYHATKRPKPDQSPYESIEAKYASCTGLSILYADALRSVGIPARLVAIPQWKDKSGNHTWVEVWDGKWHLMGASESDKLGEAWFANKADNIDSANPEHSVYAVSYKKTGLIMPLVWNRSIDYVHATDVTERYLELLKE